VHLLVTDRLACPRCGPAFGLILRADRLADRRVHEGGLGCPNCREVYPVTRGMGDLRPPPRGALGPAPLPDPEPSRVDLVHALLGIVEGPAHILALGSAARFAAALSARVPELEVVAAHPAAADWPEAHGVSRAVVGPTLPFQDRKLRGVLLEGAGERAEIREAARVLAAGGRVVVLEAGEGVGGYLIAAGLTLNAEQDGVVVATR
jgi:uncharacterized protein YbaR (Trm112 family)